MPLMLSEPDMGSERSCLVRHAGPGFVYPPPQPLMLLAGGQEGAKGETENGRLRRPGVGQQSCGAGTTVTVYPTSGQTLKLERTDFLDGRVTA